MPWLRATLALFLFSAITPAADWPQWLGPSRDGATTEKVAPWKGDLKVLWKQPVGEGNASPVIVGGKLFLYDKGRDKNEEAVTAYDAASGKQLWRTSYARPEFKSLFGNGPRATPAVAEGKVYTFGITGLLTCFDAADGKQLWQADTLKQFKADNLMFGISCSPLVVDNRVLVNVGGKGASIVAFDKDKGEVAWKSLDDKASYASPIVFGQGKDRQVVFLTGQGLVSLNPSDGTLFWKYPLVDLLSESSTTPVRAGDMLLASSITIGSVGLDLETKDGKPAMKEAWKNSELTSYFSTPVPVGKDHVYIVTGTKPPALKSSATLHCIETKTGKILWSRPNVGAYHASLMRTGDDKLLMLEEAGSLVLLDPNPKEYRELARSKVCGNTWAHPALSEGRLYVRDGKDLICIQLDK